MITRRQKQPQQSKTNDKIDSLVKKGCPETTLISNQFSNISHSTKN